ncbi:MAG: polysaccharide biosynthesis tyrosine autokinase [Nitrospirota bacterium]|nr:polysaccharide biosynthesis tyrosine autokinase [Nitrospirota bacterium]
MTDKPDNNGDIIKKQYGIQPYTQRDLPLTPDIRYNDYAAEEDVHLRDYLNVVLKRKWIVVTFFISVVITATIISFLMVPLYQSTVTLKISNQNPDALSVPGLPFSNTNAKDFYTTQYELLKSRSLAEMVIKKLELDKNPDFLPLESKLSKAADRLTKPITKAASSFMSLFEPADNEGPSKSSDKEEIPVYLSHALTSRLEINPVKDSQLVNVSFESNDPEITVDVTNALAETYIEYDLKSRIDSSRQAKEFLEKQIADTKQKTEISESNLNRYASQNEIVFLNEGKQSVLSQKLSEINNSLSAATTERMRKEALYNQIRESGTAIPEILNNSLIQELSKEHASLEAEYSNLSRTFTPDYPKMKNLKSQIDTVSARLEAEKARITKSLQSDYYAALKREKYLKDSFESLQTRVLDFQERAVQYDTLRREVDVNKELHNSLLQKLNEVGIAAMSKASGIQIVDRAVYPRYPSKPDKTLNFILSVIFGLMGGIGLAFFVEYFDNTVKDHKEIEKGMRLPSLGMIPFQNNIAAETRPLLVNADFANPVSEAFRSIGTFLLLSSSARPPKTLLITSPGGQEGKTTICINIAAVLSEALGNGIIIDADLRKPRLHNFFKVDNKNGLSKYLSGNIEFDTSDGKLIKPTSMKGISVIPSGPIPPNPSELLYSARMKDLLDALQTLYSFVIIDAPPVMGMPDSILLSSLVDGTVLVVKAGETQKTALAETKRVFNSVNAKLLGVVLNGVKKNDIKYDYYSHYFSSYFNK